MKCFRCNFVPFFLQTSLKVGNSTGFRCRILRFKMRHTFSIGDRSGLQAGQSSTRTLLPPQPGLCNVCRMWFCIVLLKYAWTSLEKMFSEGSILCSKISMYFSALMVPSQKCKLPLPRALTQPQYHDRPWLLDLLLVTVWMILFFFGRSTRRSIPSQKYLKYWFIWPQYNVSTVWWSIPDASEPREVDGASGHC